MTVLVIGSASLCLAICFFVYNIYENNSFHSLLLTIVLAITLTLFFIPLAMVIGQNVTYDRILGEKGEEITKIKCRKGKFYKFAKYENGERKWLPTEVSCDKNKE